MPDVAKGLVWPLPIVRSLSKDGSNVQTPSGFLGGWSAPARDLAHQIEVTRQLLVTNWHQDYRLNSELV